MRVSARNGLWIALTLVLSACGAGLKGTWQATGELNITEYQRFQGTLRFENEVSGWADIDFGTSTQRRPVCSGTLNERKLAFAVDGSDRLSSCSTMATPFFLRGDLGHQVMSGEIFDASNRRIGMWRAFRQPE